MDVRRLLSAMALEVHGVDTPDEAVDRIAHYARIAVDADDSGILLVGARGKAQTSACTSAKVEQAHALQTELNEGPCLDAIRTDTSTWVTDDAQSDRRWPSWGPRVTALGYSADADAFSKADLEVMQVLGAHASVAIATSREMDNLRAALDSRTLIGQAQGVLMAVYDLDATGAFHYLRRLSQDGNIRIVKVSEHVIAQRHELRKQINDA
jgi:cysteine sulfinate desulfinase/cysteine desulfurase-like protein